MAFRTFTALALALALAAQGGWVQDWTGWYLGAHVGSSRVDTTAPADGSGPNAGVHLGYHHEFASRAVLGGEFEFNETWIDLDDGNKVSGLCRMKAVLGYSYGDLLPYAFAGLGKFRSDDLGDNFGWAYGAGLAYRMSANWAISGEFALHDHTDIGGAGLNADANSATLRLSYRF